MALDWNSSDLDCHGATGAQLVCFAGGLQVTVFNLTTQFKPSPLWRITWDGEAPPLAAHRKKFKTRREAKRAVEEIFDPIVRIAPRLVSVRTVITADKGTGGRS